MLTVICHNPSCGKAYRVGDDKADSYLHCPNCRHPMLVPAIEGPPASGPEAGAVEADWRTEAPATAAQTVVEPERPAAPPVPRPVVHSRSEPSSAELDSKGGYVCGVLSVVYGAISVCFPMALSLAGVTLGVISLCLCRRKRLGVIGIVLSSFWFALFVLIATILYSASVLAWLRRLRS
jgi:hypothetical protein